MLGHCDAGRLYAGLLMDCQSTGRQTVEGPVPAQPFRKTSTQHAFLVTSLRVVCLLESFSPKESIARLLCTRVQRPAQLSRLGFYPDSVP